MSKITQREVDALNKVIDKSCSFNSKTSEPTQICSAGTSSTILCIARIVRPERQT